MASPYLIAFRPIYYMPGEIFLHPGAKLKVETDSLESSRSKLLGNLAVAGNGVRAGGAATPAG
jgi:hypothetical protein